MSTHTFVLFLHVVGATDLLPFSAWFELGSPMARAVLLKLGLLACTALLAVDARLRIIPRLTPEKLGRGRTVLSVR